jgi:CCR4-NOT transcription complex subunit 1
VLRLLIDLFKFLSPLIGNAKMRDTSRLLYRGTLRILLVLLHDYPEFLSSYHFSLCDVIPPSCIQLRNLVLTAFPRNMQLPDPFTPDLKVDLLPETKQHPRILSDYVMGLMGGNFKDDIDSYLKTRGPVSFLLDLRSKLLLPAYQLTEYSTCRYDMNMINALVLYVGVQAIADCQNEPQQGFTPITHSPQMDIFQQLLVDLDTEGRYLFLTAVANQLRYPNSHTHYFSCVLLYLFSEATQDVIKEQITRCELSSFFIPHPHHLNL